MNYDNTNSGAIFKNAKKESDKHPDLTGQLNVDGVELWVSAWAKMDKNGNKYLSLAVKRKEVRQATTTTHAEEAYNDDLPF